MGLPSGLQWASCNIGAEKPSELGLYFSWGNIEGHRIDEGYEFTEIVYASTPAASIAVDLPLDQDAARAYLGDHWRMPTPDEFQELIDNCTITWTTQNGVAGNLFTSNLNGKYLFFPAAGYFTGTSLVNRGSKGNYWTSKYDSASLASKMGFDASSINSRYTNPRYYGFTVRAVLQPT